MATVLSDLLHDRPLVQPKIYGFIIPGLADHEGYIKIGYTEKENAEDRINEILHTAAVEHKTLFVESSMRNDGTVFTDKDVHNLLLRKGYKKKYFNGDTDNEWFKIEKDDVLIAIKEIRNNVRYDGNRTEDFSMRDEQSKAVKDTISYFKRINKEEPDITPKFLWNAKMRFGKTFATYQLIKKMNMKRVLILTFKPAVESAWEYDLNHHVDFNNWQFISNKEARYDASKIDDQFKKCDKNKPIVVFVSFQDALGTNESGGIKAKNEFIHKEKWDLVVFDEYHFGAWRDNAKKLFEKEDEEDNDFDLEEYQNKEAGNAINETWLPITTNYYLYLSGTPFRALNSGEFLEEQIFNWTYSDEQNAKISWDDSKGKNPYASLPQMVMLTYKIPDSITEPAINEGYDEFDINEFFKAEYDQSKGVKTAQFIYKEYVQKWVDLIQGKGNFIDGLKLNNEKPPMPYSDTTLLGILIHTLWFFSNVASCYAMFNLLNEPQNKFFRDYKIIVCAGLEVGNGVEALTPVEIAMDDPLKTKTITLTCGKLTTGVTVRPWSGVFMLRNLKSPETYFQTAFRVQNPWVVKDEKGNDVIMKHECYIFDFALERALSQISDYSVRLNTTDDSAEKKVAEFINFLPVLAFDGAAMNQISAQDVLDITYSGTSATLLAKRWQTALLVHVDNDTLLKLKANPEAMKALENLEGFRKLNEQIQTIINRSEKIKKLQTKDKEPTEKQKKELSEAEKEMKSIRKQVQENLLKLASRIPAFMFLTDYREQTLKDVITQIEPDLFRKVTGLTVKNFETLCSIGLFDSEKMNQGIFGFRRYENSSLSYTGIDKHEGEDVGGWDTVLKRDEYNALYAKQQATMIDFADAINSDKGIDDYISKNKDKTYIFDNNNLGNTYRAVAQDDPQYSAEPEPELLLGKTKEEWEKLLNNIKPGDKVVHQNFGEGNVIAIKDNSKKIDVKFSDGKKTFIFPDAFLKGFLSIK